MSVAAPPAPQSVPIAAAVPLSPADVGEPAHPTAQPLEWWYANVLLDAPGTPIDGMCLIGAFVRVDGVTEEGRHVLICPDRGLFRDFGTGDLPVGTIASSGTELDVRSGPNYLRGGYPDYELHVEGTTQDGECCSASFRYEADVEPERAGYVNSQLKHFVVHRLRASGSVTIGAGTYEATGVGYYEHLLGTMGWREPFLGDPAPPAFIDGWNWYWSPAAGADGVVVQVGGLIVEDRPVPFVSLTVGGERASLFTSGTVEVLEERTYDGVSYAHKLRLTDRNDDGEIDLVITRRDAAHSITKHSRGARLVFVTGFAELEGRVTLHGIEYDVKDRAWGSVFRMSLGRPLQLMRRLPTRLRIPLGRLLARLERRPAKS